MGDNALSIVSMGQLMIIGTLDVRILKSPRIIGRNPDGSNAFLELVGRPSELYLGAPGEFVVWTPQDEALVNEYRAAVTGLTLATNILGNVIPMGGRKQ